LQTNVEANVELRTSVDAFATYEFCKLPVQPAFDLLPGLAVSWKATRDLPRDKANGLETLNLADEAVFTVPRNRPETHPWFDRFDKNRGSIMLAILLNAIYCRFLDAALPGMTSQGAGRWPR
jgi:hypothetical protein